jgi:hypothetical protein
MSMQINPTPQIGLTNAGTAQGVMQKGGGGGDGRSITDGVRADWSVRMNVRHELGFVGGAARLLFHNQVAEERTTLVFYMPTKVPCRLEMQSANVASAKPGTPAAAGQTLAFRTEGNRVKVTIPLMRLNDWIYLDIAWTGGFPTGGMSFAGAQIPLGEFHPQLAIEAFQDGRVVTALVSARYEVEVESDPGARVLVEGDDSGRGVQTEAAQDGRTLIHKFQANGRAAIHAKLAPAGSVGGY